MAYVILGLFALISPLIAVLFYFINKTKFQRLNYWIKQVIYGVVFGGIAILCTEFGVKNEGAVMNVRDSAPIVAGLIFGWPAGLISGTIGGLERFFSAYWNGTYYTQMACSISTFLSGALASLLHFIFYKKKKVSWYQGILIGALLETNHILMIFVTHISDPFVAFAYVSKIGNPMIIATALSVGLTAGLYTLFTYVKKDSIPTSGRNWKISSILQLSLFISVLSAYLAMASFTSALQTNIAEKNAHNNMIEDVTEVSNYVEDTSNEHLLDVTEQIADHLEGRHLAGDTVDSAYIKSLIDNTILGGTHFVASEINIINAEGIIEYSTNDSWIGLDMQRAGNQTYEFYEAMIINKSTTFVQKYGHISGDMEIYMKYAAYDLSYTGFVQVGYNTDVFYSELKSIISKTVSNRRVGNDGFLLVFDRYDNIVGKTESITDADTIEGLKLSVKPTRLQENKMYKATIALDEEEINIRVLVKQKEGYYIMACMRESEISFNRNMSIYVSTYEQFIIFGIIYLIVYGIFAHFVFHDLENVNEGLKQITEGNLNVELHSHYSKEFGELNYSINKTVKTLKAINEKEMQNAKAIQMGALPAKEAYFDVHHFDIFAEMKTAREVGGDFYDYFPIGKDKMAILVADVSGKGIPAALFMMRTKSLMKSLLETGMSIDEAVKHTNIQLCENNETSMFVTCWIGLVHMDTGLVEYVNAGHNPPAIKQNGTYTLLKSIPNLVMGGLKRARYEKQLLVLQPGDVIFLYTDGITEAMRADNSMYGEERLITYLNSTNTLDPKRLTTGVLEDTMKFVGDFEQSDDMTMLTFSYYGYANTYLYEYDGVIENFAKAKEDLNKDLIKENIPEDVIVKTLVCYDEIFSNCAKYAYANKKGKINVRLDISKKQLALTISDSGEAFNPLEKQDADVTSSLENRKIGGLGIHMVKNFMDQYHYYYQDSRNVLILQKYLNNKK